MSGSAAEPFIVAMASMKNDGTYGDRTLISHSGFVAAEGLGTALTWSMPVLPF
jgi:hypothetical protein